MSKTTESPREPSNRSLRNLIVGATLLLTVLAYGVNYKKEARDRDILEFDVAEAEVVLALASQKDITHQELARLTAATNKLREAISNKE